VRYRCGVGPDSGFVGVAAAVRLLPAPVLPAAQDRRPPGEPRGGARGREGAHLRLQGPHERKRVLSGDGSPSLSHTTCALLRDGACGAAQTLCRKEYTPAQMEEFQVPARPAQKAPTATPLTCASHQDFSILEYRVNMRLDNLPVAEVRSLPFLLFPLPCSRPVSLLRPQPAQIQSFYYDDKPDETVRVRASSSARSSTTSRARARRARRRGRARSGRCGCTTSGTRSARSCTRRCTRTRLSPSTTC